MQKNLTPLLVVAVALIARNGTILLQRRRLDAEHGGLWEFPGGKVEAGETAENAAIREIAEELGITISPADLHARSFASGITESGQRLGRAIVILLYTCTQWQGTPLCHDGEEIRWFAREDIAALDMPPLDYPLADALQAPI